MSQDGASHLEKAHSMRLSHDPCLGVVDILEVPRACREEGQGFLRDVCRMIVEDETNNRLWRIVGVDVLKQFNELALRCRSSTRSKM